MVKRTRPPTSRAATIARISLCIASPFGQLPGSGLRRGHAKIYLGLQSWRLWHQKPVELRDLKTCVYDELVNPAIHVTPNAEDFLNRIEPILPPRDLRVVATPVLEEDE